jgi:hypothetical protein
MAVIQGQNLVVVKPSAWGQIMERLTKLQRRLFAAYIDKSFPRDEGSCPQTECWQP